MRNRLINTKPKEFEYYNGIQIHADTGVHLLLSTPNITSFLSRALFFLTGRFHQFNNGDLSYGHINPVSAFELEQAATQPFDAS